MARTTLDEYFHLSDLAGHDEENFRKLIALFADDATIIPNQSGEIKGKESIARFFNEFFKRNAEVHHVWHTTKKNNQLETKWAVSGRRETGEIFALSGKDIAKLNAASEIQHLKVIVD
ncbi:nuclear transport factor 2 family protein [Sporolactobacillus pectinivorans]|uniref:nuclear transport factor 2 family protein n=1 Tax=Sporolactobacillus pectinivorans TaxID=1591408 RepID=UPI000C261F4D|nr:nuclear transport factor 2 family protein [Sporolactobacillus pectinivorans]